MLGTFANDEFEHGELHDAVGNVFISIQDEEKQQHGYFQKDRLCGFGRCIYSGGDRYQGYFSGGKRSGVGTMIFSQFASLLQTLQESTYEGNWIGTKKNGQGIETWPNGYIYKGEFKNSEWNGQGILTFPDGSTYEGEWVNGFMNGKGTFTWSDGKEKKGIWKDGKLQE